MDTANSVRTPSLSPATRDILRRQDLRRQDLQHINNHRHARDCDRAAQQVGWAADRFRAGLVQDARDWLQDARLRIDRLIGETRGVR